MAYLPGQRVTLVYTDDPYTGLRPGDEGTVTAHHEDLNTVEIDWDSGSRLAMCLDAGDRITPQPPRHTQPTPPAGGRVEPAEAGR